MYSSGSGRGRVQRFSYPFEAGYFNPFQGANLVNNIGFPMGNKTKYKPIFSRTFKLPNSSAKTVVRERYHAPSIQIKRPASQNSRAEYICLNEIELADLVGNYKTKVLPAILECKNLCRDHVKKLGQEGGLLDNLGIPHGYIAEEEVEECEELPLSKSHLNLKRSVEEIKKVRNESNIAAENLLHKSGKNHDEEEDKYDIESEEEEAEEEIFSEKKTRQFKRQKVADTQIDLDLVEK